MSQPTGPLSSPLATKGMTHGPRGASGRALLSRHSIPLVGQWAMSKTVRYFVCCYLGTEVSVWGRGLDGLGGCPFPEEQSCGKAAEKQCFQYIQLT